MSLLSIAQSVCDQVGFPRPASIAASSDQLARQLFALANKELRELSKSMGWAALDVTYQFDTVIGQDEYALPSDYKSLVSDTVWRNNDFWRVRGGMSPQEWAYRKRQLLNTLDYSAFRLIGSPLKFVIDPVPQIVDTYTFEYRTKFFAIGADNVRKERYAVDTDTSLVDEDLVEAGLMWRFKHAKGLEFSADVIEYDSMVQREFAKQLGSGAIPVGGYNTLSPLTDGYVRDNGFGE